MSSPVEWYRFVCRSARLVCHGVCLRRVGVVVVVGGFGWGLQSPDFLTLPLSDTCERSGGGAGSLRLSTLLCNRKVRVTPAGSLQSAPGRAAPPPPHAQPHPYPHPRLSEAKKNPLKSRPDQKEAQSQDTICSHLGLSMTGEHWGGS